MYSYLLDSICAHNAFPGMNWAWSPRELVVHSYCKILSNCSHRVVVEKLTDHFLIPLYKMIFEEEPSYMSHGAMEAILEIAYWFASPDDTFLRVFDDHKLSHIFLRYATNKLVKQEVSYHLSTGLLGDLHRKKKAPWPALPTQI